MSPKHRGESDDALVEGVLHGHRRAIGKAITLVESRRPADRARALTLLDALQPASGGSLRVGVSGAPGVGKSTLVEALGLLAVERGRRVAVLAVDPSSPLSGGSVLGDKTRMERLAHSDAAFIRPSPTAGARGGVTGTTREAIVVCEAAGFDVVIVETVGVGQSEVEVAAMTDVFVLLELPFAGDDLQAIKRGSVELADLVVYTKSDLDPAAATAARGRTSDALGLLRPRSPHWRARVLSLSAVTGEGVPELWAALEEFAAAMTAAGAIVERRAGQASAWMWSLVDVGLRHMLSSDRATGERLAALTDAVASGKLAPAAAAQEILDSVKGAR